MGTFHLPYEWMLRFHASLFKTLSYLKVTQISMICKSVAYQLCEMLEVRLNDRVGSRGENNLVEGREM